MATPPVTTQPESVRSPLTSPPESESPPSMTQPEPMTPPPNYESVMSGKSDLPPAYDSPFVSRLNVADQPTAPEDVPSALVPENNDEEVTPFCCEQYYDPMTTDCFTCFFCNIFCHPITAFLRLCGCEGCCAESRSGNNNRTSNINERSYNAVDNTWVPSRTDGGLGGCFCCSDDDCLINFCECDDCEGFGNNYDNADCWGGNDGNTGYGGGDTGGGGDWNGGDTRGGGNDDYTDTGGGDYGGDSGGGDTGGTD